MKRVYVYAYAYAILFFLVLGCTNQQRKVHGTLNSTQTFPNGVYRHEVSLKLQDGGERNFSGIVSLKPETITVVGLSSFSTTVFKIKEDRKSGKVETEIYFEPFRKIESKIVEFYKLTREFLLLLKNENQKHELKLSTGNFLMQFKDWDENQIPGIIIIYNKDINIQIKVVGYELEKN